MYSLFVHGVYMCVKLMPLVNAMELLVMFPGSLYGFTVHNSMFYMNAYFEMLANYAKYILFLWSLTYSHSKTWYKTVMY